MTISATASNLDIEKFRKVRLMMDKGATDGERAAAKARAEAMAARAGLTLAQATSRLSAPPAAASVNFFAGFDDWMEQKEPGWKAQKAAARAGRERDRAMKRAKALAKYGSCHAIFSRTECEELLLAACLPLTSESDTWQDEDGSIYLYLKRIDGCGDHGSVWHLKDMTPAFVAAVQDAYTVPPNLGGVLAEWRDWRRLEELRDIFTGDGEWIHYIEVQGRIVILEDRLDRQPAASWSDMAARMEWWSIKIDREFSASAEEERELHARISADHEILAGLNREAAANGSVHSGRRTNADKRAAVLSMLDTHPDLSDREIARRAGVSPQTVNNWRKRYPR